MSTFSLCEYTTRKNNYNHVFLKPEKYITFLKRKQKKEGRKERKNEQTHSVVPGIPYMVAKDKTSCSQLGTILPSREHLAMSGDILDCHILGEGKWYWLLGRRLRCC